MYTTTRGWSGHKSHTYCFWLWFETVPCCCCLCGGCGLSFLCCTLVSLLAVFQSASAFNQNVSNWNTGAVTTMQGSKCTLSLSPSLWPRRLPLWCVVEYIYDNSRFVESQKSHTFCGGFGLSFLCCTLLSSCSVSFRICVQSARVELEHGGGDNDGRQ